MTKTGARSVSTRGTTWQSCCKKISRSTESLHFLCAQCHCQTLSSESCTAVQTTASSSPLSVSGPSYREPRQQRASLSQWPLVSDVLGSQSKGEVGRSAAQEKVSLVSFADNMVLSGKQGWAKVEPCLQVRVFVHGDELTHRRASINDIHNNI